MEKKKLRIGLVGHGLNSGNLGIAALSYTNIAIINDAIDETVYDVEFYLFLSDGLENYKWFEKENGIKVFSCPELYNQMGKDNLLRYINDVKKCDVFFDICGGDSFSDIYGYKRFLKQFISKFFILMNKKYLILAPQTLGPFTNKIVKIMAKYIFKKAKIVFSRDKLSVSYVKAFAPKISVKEVTDTAFALPYSNTPKQNGKYNIGINISALLYNGGYTRSNQFGLKMNYKKFIDELLDYLSKNKNYQIHIVAHVFSKSVIENDYLVGQSYIEKYDNIILAPLFKTPIQAKSYISSLDFFIGSRMHSTIASFSSGVPTVPIAYSRKFKGIFEKYNYGYIIDAKVHDELESLDMVIKFIKIADELKLEVDKTVEHIHKDLDKYEKVLKHFFRKFGE